MKIFEKQYIRAAKAPHCPQFIIRSGVPEQLQPENMLWFLFLLQVLKDVMISTFMLLPFIIIGILLLFHKESGPDRLRLVFFASIFYITVYVLIALHIYCFFDSSTCQIIAIIAAVITIVFWGILARVFP